MYFRLPFVSRQLFNQLEADLQRLSKVVNDQHAIISAQREALNVARRTAAASSPEAEAPKRAKATGRRPRRAKAA